MKSTKKLAMCILTIGLITLGTPSLASATSNASYVSGMSGTTKSASTNWYTFSLQWLKG